MYKIIKIGHNICIYLRICYVSYDLYEYHNILIIQTLYKCLNRFAINIIIYQK